MASAYDTWLTTTPEDAAHATAERNARRETAAQAKVDAEPYPTTERTYACLRWNAATGRAEPGTFTAHADDFAHDPLRGSP